jgi:hypothetical protein
LTTKHSGRRGDNPSHLAKSGFAAPRRTIMPSRFRAAYLPRGATSDFESKLEIHVTSSSSSSASSSRKPLTIIQTLTIVGAAGLIGSMLLKLLV